MTYTKISLCDGKYKIVRNDDNYQFECLRYDEKWRDLTGDKMLWALVDHVVNLRVALHRLLHEDMQNDITAACQQAREALGET